VHGVTNQSPPFEDLRHEVRAWCARTVPADWRTQQAGADHASFMEFQRWWRDQLAEAGYFIPHWPKQWGGSAMSLGEQVVLYEELARGDAPRNVISLVAVYNAAPAIMHAGTDRQRQQYLSAIAGGEIWCQGFSEPNAGSDLASLQTRAVRDGDHFVVNGQKIWTSLANEAQRCILLARTNPDVPKHRGISFFVMDMDSPGIEVRPIRNAVGESEFCETFLTDVMIPAENLIGAENDGWAVSQQTLGSERAVTLVNLAELLRRNGRGFLIESAQRWQMPDGTPAVDDSTVREEIGGLYGEVEILRLLLTRMITRLLSDGGTGPESSVVKVYYSELLQRLMRIGMELEGAPTQILRPTVPSSGWESRDFLRDFINSFGWTIAGGTNEIMRNIVAEKVLGLPREPPVPVPGARA
jgi:alkylation response protein AidB-like acyl-CoA dehydrogenase